MLIVTDPSSVDDPHLQRLLRQRFEQLSDYDRPIAELASFLVIEPADALSAIEAELGFSPMVNFVDGLRFGDPEWEPSWEWLEDHGGWFEMVFILSDDGFGWVLFVEDHDGVDPELLGVCRAYSTTNRP